MDDVPAKTGIFNQYQPGMGDFLLSPGYRPVAFGPA
jgi:hypothetical protein